MKATLWVGLLTVSLLAVPTRAAAWCICCPSCPPIHCDWCFKCRFNIHCGDSSTQLGPWYQYYPYEAHFQTPAPLGHFPNWQAPMATAPAGPALPGAPAPGQWQPPAPRPAVQPTGYFQPVGYSYPQVPSYWYERR
jgi:hypothetical protein